MKVVIKKPDEVMKVIEVSDLMEINKLVGNVDENGEGCMRVERMGVFKGIDIYMNEWAQFNNKLPQNFWDIEGRVLYCGNVIFAGFDRDKKEYYGACSLSDEQIEYLEKNIGSKYDIPNIINR